MGSIYKRGKTYWIKYYANGKPFYESSESQKQSDARRLLKVREGEIGKGKTPGIYFDRVKFDELAKDFLWDYEINGKKSIDRAKRSVKHLTKHFGGYKVPKITTPKIQAFIKGRMNEGVTNATINRELSALKRMLNLGARQTPPKVDRVPYIAMLKENNVRTGFFEHADFIALRNHLPEYLEGFVTFGYRTGWRFGEVTCLTWSQVDLENGIVRLEPGKTKNDDARTVYLDEELKEVFQKQWECRGSGKKVLPYVFPNEIGTDKISDFRGAWQTACKNAGIGNKLFHDFRRTAVRNMIRSGISEGVAMKISGHKTRSVFDRYNIVNDADLQIAAQKQAAYLKSQMVTKTVTMCDFDKKKEATNV